MLGPFVAVNRGDGAKGAAAANRPLRIAPSRILCMVASSPSPRDPGFLVQEEYDPLGHICHNSHFFWTIVQRTGQAGMPPSASWE